MDQKLEQKLERLEGLYLKTKNAADRVPALQRKVAELQSDLAEVSKSAVTEAVAGEIADALTDSGLKIASRQDFVERLVGHPHEIADTVRKVASLSQPSAIQTGRPGDGPSGNTGSASYGLDPLDAFALGQ